jgi:hypothetical protein
MIFSWTFVHVVTTSGRNINMFRCKVNKTVLRMDIDGRFRRLIKKPHFIKCDEIFRKLVCFEVK